MNEELESYARKQIRDGLAKLPDRMHLMFKRMYSPENLEADVYDVVATMPEDRLDWAMQQISRSVAELDK